MASLFGGPGWFNDVFQVQVVFDTDKRSYPSVPDADDDLEVCLCCWVGGVDVALFSTFLCLSLYNPAVPGQ